MTDRRVLFGDRYRSLRFIVCPGGNLFSLEKYVYARWNFRLTKGWYFVPDWKSIGEERKKRNRRSFDLSSGYLISFLIPSKFHPFRRLNFSRRTEKKVNRRFIHAGGINIRAAINSRIIIRFALPLLLPSSPSKYDRLRALNPINIARRVHATTKASVASGAGAEPLANSFLRNSSSGGWKFRLKPSPLPHL